MAKAITVSVDDVCKAINALSKDFYLEDCATDFWENDQYVMFNDDGTYTPTTPGLQVRLNSTDCYLAYEGNGDEAEARRGLPSTFVKYFKQFMKNQTHITMAVEVPKDKQEKFRSLCASMGVLIK